MAGIKKIDVSRGITWIEIPEAKLFIQCGCPADSVKHLMKKGLIVPVEEQGVRYESGPNAILLSDALIQNGELSNLAEFPVLQMLYRQGMLLPKHPNNTGQKPLLIGAEAQVQAQLRYIYRGNYGLASEEELASAGLSPQRIRDEMRIKLRFAFGNIAPSEKLLDSVTVGRAKVEIASGVSIRRIRHNVFEFSYKDETVEVDLNLPAGEGFECPYPLGNQNVGREYFSVVHSGDGDGWDINRPAMSSILMYQGDIYLIDAGPNVYHSLTALGIGVNEIKGIFHTHAHDDHFCGLPTLMNTDHRIAHYATPAVRLSVKKKWAALLSRPENEFDNFFRPVDLKEGTWNNLDGLEVKPMFSPHPVETSIMFFRAKSEQGYKTYAHLADITSKDVLERFIANDEADAGISKELFDEVWKSYLTKADVKKIDIGGGLIHGKAIDFSEDASKKIILSHTAMPLTAEEREIGSSASFGMTEVFIEGKQEFTRSLAYGYLSRYLSGVKKHELRMLMNGEIEVFNPGSILIKRDQSHSDVYMIITGVVELLDSDRKISNQVGAGTLIGEFSGTMKRPASTTSRALSHVRALRISGRLLRDVIHSNKLTKQFVEMRIKREVLQETWLFGNSVSHSVLNTIAQKMELVSFVHGETISYHNKPGIYLLAKGNVDVMFGDQILEQLNEGGFIGEGYVLFNTPCITSGLARTDVDVFFIPAEAVNEIPVVRWKLHETFRHRAEAIVSATPAQEDIFVWKNVYNTGVVSQDDDHKHILSKAQDAYFLIKKGCPLPQAKATLDELIAVTQEHFAREIDLLKKAKFPELEHHKELHKHLLQDVQRKCESILDNCENRGLEFLIFFKNWLIDHIITEDRKFGAYVTMSQKKQ